MAITFIRGTSNRVVASNTSKTTGTLASAATTGQLLLFIAWIQDSGGSRTVTPPSGFTALWTREIAGSTMYAAYKVAGGSEGTSYSYSWTTTSFTQSDIIAIWDGEDTTTPMDVTASDADVGFTNSHSLPSITTVTDQAMAIGISFGAGLGAWGAPSGWTEQFDTTDIQVVEKIITPAAATGTATVTHSFGSTGAGILALRPAAGGGGATSLPVFHQRIPQAILAR